MEASLLEVVTQVVAVASIVQRAVPQVKIEREEEGKSSEPRWISMLRTLLSIVALNNRKD